MTKHEILAAMHELATYDGCFDVICSDVEGDNCECAKQIKRAFHAAEEARVRRQLKAK